MAVLVSEDGLERTDLHAVERSDAENQTAFALMLAALHDGEIGGRREVDVVDRARADLRRDVVEQRAETRLLREIESLSRLFIHTSHEDRLEDRPDARSADDDQKNNQFDRDVSEGEGGIDAAATDE